MKMVEIRKEKTIDLTTQATRLREEIAEASRRKAMGEVQNVRGIRMMRKDLARILTVIGEQLREETK